MLRFLVYLVSIALTIGAWAGGAPPTAPARPADAAPAPLSPMPDFGQPVPGSSGGGEASPSDTGSSSTAPIPSAPDIPALAPTTIELPDSGGSDIETPTVDGVDGSTVTGAWKAVGDTGIEVAATDAAGSEDQSITVGVLSDAEAAARGLGGVVVSLTRNDDAASSTPAGLKIPVELLEAQYGADFSSRVSWVQVSDGDADRSRADVTAVPSANTDEGVVLTPSVSKKTALVAAKSSTTANNGTGTYSATPLKSSSSWDVADQTGAFTWSYTMAPPKPTAGPAPSLGLSYNSQSVDGETGSTNNQPSMVGEGWDLTVSGFIERGYASCAKDDGASGAVTTSGDLCWKSDNATVSFAGHSGPLVRDASSGRWRLQDDDGTRFEHLQGTSQGCAANGTDAVDCWKMTTTDGTQYYFGLNQLPGWSSGKPTTNSTWTVPVFGNDPGEPCHASTFAASSCVQAWRWNLDYVVDVHGNAEAFYYTAESNKYAKNGTGATSYQRGGALSRIEYGLRASNVFATNGAGYRVLFTYDPRGRCSDASGATCTTAPLDAAVAPSTPAAYPDVPFDQLCTGTSCSSSQISPTFFTNARLTKVETQALVAGSYSTVDGWVLSHSFPAPGDSTSAALWLTSVQRTGTAAGQAAIVQPKTEFSGTTMQNRVWVVDGLAPLNKWRLSSIKTELGGVISVNYAGQQCTAAQAPSILAAPESNTNWCFPEWWRPDNAPAKQDLFHKYPVVSIVADGATGGGLSTTQKTQYIYGTPRWRYNESTSTPAASKTWNVFAGVDTVEVREGDSATPSAQKVTKTTYYQGMNGDRANAAGSTRTSTVSGTSIPDERWFAGRMYRQQTLLGVGGAIVSDQVDTPWASNPTADDGGRKARLVETSRSVVTEPLSTGGSRTLDTRRTFDGTYGYVVTEARLPSDATATCTTTSYAAANTSAWIVGAPSEVRTVAKSCDDLSAAQYPADLVADARTAYDGGAWGAAPSKGLITAKTVVDRYDNGQPHWATVESTTYDTLGRPLVVTDGLGRTTTTTYTPAAAQPLTSRSTTNTSPFSWVTTTSVDPATGATTSIVDPNGGVTSIDTDALGRTSKVWLPNWPKADNPTSPSMAFAYTLSQSSPNAVQTTALTAGGTTSKFELFDGLGRAVQTQSAAESGGTVVKTTGYDSQGRPYWVDNEYWTTSVSPSTTFFNPDSESAIPSQTITSYDAVGRTTKTTLKSTGAVRFETSTSYVGADRVDEVPPNGGTPTTVFTNSLGKKTKLIQYLAATVSGVGQTTNYSYDAAGRLVTMSDPAGNTWRSAYDLLGRRVGQVDPDSGASSATYDLVGNMLTSTDARGQTLTTTYDGLNRKTATYSGTSSGALLASWTYDSVKKGMLDSSASYTGSTPGAPGLAYKTTVAAYDSVGNPLDTTISIPSGAPAFGGTTYRTVSTYNVDNTVATQSVPAVGGLPAETVRYTYNAWGRQLSVRGSTSVLNGTVYTPTGQLGQFNRSYGGNGGYSTYSYDPATSAVLGIQDNAVFGGSGHYVADRTYTRDDAGNITSLVSQSVLPNAATLKACYSYDALRQLTRAWTPNDSTACTATPTTATMGGPAPFWLDYTYDNVTGNRTAVKSRTASGSTSDAAYSYPAAGSVRPHAVSAVTGASALGSGAYSYDAAGNMTGRPGQILTFDEFGKVSKVVTGSVTQTNVYDAAGTLLLRVSTAEGAALFLGDTTLTQAAGATVIAGVRTYYGASRTPVAERSAKTGTTGTTLTWLFTDVTGTVDTQTVVSSGVTSRLLRDPFGVPVGGSPSVWSDGNGYLHKPATPSTGLTTIGARTYDALLGKFLSVDPVLDAGNPQQNIGYGYAANSPVSFTDPSGLRYEGVGCGGCRGQGKKPMDSFPSMLGGCGMSYNPCGAPGAKPATAGGGVGGGLQACGYSYNPCGGRAPTDEERWLAAAFFLDGDAASIASIFFGNPKGVGKGATLTQSGILTNKARGDRARDEVMALHPGATPEKSLNTTLGQRRVDIFTTEGVAIEVKLGFVGMSPTVYRQVMKDILLRDEGQVKSVEWVFKYSEATGEVGPSTSVALLLNQMGIDYKVVP